MWAMVLGVFVLLTFAVARLTRLVTADQITLPLRRWVVNRYGEESGRAYLIHCRACASVWIAFPVAVIWALATLPLQWWWLGVPAWLTMSHLTILLARLEEE